jgi:hypothetical protein
MAVFSFHGDSGCIYLPPMLPLQSTAAAAAAAAAAEMAAALPATSQLNANDVRPVVRVYRQLHSSPLAPSFGRRGRSRSNIGISNMQPAPRHYTTTRDAVRHQTHGNGDGLMVEQLPACIRPSANTSSCFGSFGLSATHASPPPAAAADQPTDGLRRHAAGPGRVVSQSGRSVPTSRMHGGCSPDALPRCSALLLLRRCRGKSFPTAPERTPDGPITAALRCVRWRRGPRDDDNRLYFEFDTRLSCHIYATKAARERSDDDDGGSAARYLMRFFANSEAEIKWQNCKELVEWFDS